MATNADYRLFGGLTNMADTAVQRKPGELMHWLTAQADGCGVLCAPTGGANRAQLEAHGLHTQVADTNRELVALAKAAAAGKHPQVAGVLSATGYAVEPYGETPFAEVMAVFSEQAEALLHAGCDQLLIDAPSSLNEARAALLAARETELPVTVLLRWDAATETAAGAQFEAAAVILQSLRAAAVGLRIGDDVDGAAQAFAEARTGCSLPLMAVCDKPEPETLQRLAAEGVTLFGSSSEKALPTPLPEPVSVQRGDSEPVAANENERFFLSDQWELTDCEIPFEQSLLEAEDDGTIARVTLSSPEDVTQLLECIHMSTLPVAVLTYKAALLDDALLRCPARLLVDSMCDIDEQQLQQIITRYGALRL